MALWWMCLNPHCGYEIHVRWCFSSLFYVVSYYFHFYCCLTFTFLLFYRCYYYSCCFDFTLQLTILLCFAVFSLMLLISSLLHSFSLKRHPCDKNSENFYQKGDILWSKHTQTRFGGQNIITHANTRFYEHRFVKTSQRKNNVSSENPSNLRSIRSGN